VCHVERSKEESGRFLKKAAQKLFLAGPEALKQRQPK
jgi:hypothetical protein